MVICEMNKTSYQIALELRCKLSQEVGYQERVTECAGECYDGHYKDMLKNNYGDDKF